MKKRRFLRNTGLFILALIMLEIVLRLIGFGEVPKYERSVNYDYALQSSQDITRFGNSFYINAAGMRSDEVDEAKVTILKLGDSVLNGGIGTDQSELASTKLEENLIVDGVDCRVYNVSAGSWGPDNAFAWMNEHGDFGADVVVLVFSSHDWLDHRNCRDVVGHVNFYPEADPILALTDAFNWAMTRFLSEPDWDEIPLIENCTPNTGSHNAGWDEFIAYSAAYNIDLVVYHHPSLEEISNGKYDEKGQALASYLQTYSVNYISGLDAGYSESAFRDRIHPNALGQEIIEKAIRPVVLKLLQNES